VAEHRRGDLAGVCAARLFVAVLRAEQDAALADQLAGGGDRREGRRDADADRGEVAHRVRDAANESAGLVLDEVHFPVTGNEVGTLGHGRGGVWESEEMSVGGLDARAGRGATDRRGGYGAV